MRLVCPNCGAQYEIDASLIPETGRDVQCSNCGHGWFEAGRARAPEPTRVDPARTVADPAPPAQPAFHPDDRLHETARANAIGGVVPNAPEPRQRGRSAETDEMDAILRALDDANSDPAPRRRGPPPAFEEEPDDDIWATEGARPRPMDAPRPSDDVMDILRSEAAREQAVRRAEAEAQSRFEDQAEFDMDPPPRRERTAIAPEGQGWAPHSAPPFDGADEEARIAAASQVAGGGRERFPDIEEVSSHLGGPRGRRTQAHPSLPMDPAARLARRQNRLGRRLGFSGAVFAAVLGLGLYAQSNTVAAQVPALAGPISGYVDWVNGMRFQLDGAARNLAAILRG